MKHKTLLTIGIIFGIAIVAQIALASSWTNVQTDPSGNLYAPANFNASGTITIGGVAVSTSSGSSTLIYASSGISATASGTNGYIIGNTGVTSFNGATGTITFASSSAQIAYYVAASNATTSEKNIANFVCTGTNDYQGCIQPALLAASNTTACVVLSDGNFNVGTSTVFFNRQGGCLMGSGMNATVVTGSNATATIQIGNRQAGAAMYGYESLSNVTVANTNPSSTQTVWMDGWGNNGTMNNVAILNQDGGLHALTLEDIDRDSMTNVYIQGGQISPLFSEIGLENTWSNFDATQVVIVPETVGNVSSTDWLWGIDPDQTNSAGYSRVDLTNVHYFCPSSITPGSTGLRFASGTGATTFQNNIALYENCDLPVVAPYEDDITDYNSSYLMDSGTSTADITVSHYANLTFNGDNFQQANSVFYNPAGSGAYPNIILQGNNKNGGNIGQVFNGNFGLISGDDTVFAGDNELSLGNSSQRMANVVSNNVIASSTNTQTLTITSLLSQNCLGTNGSGVVGAGTCSGGGGASGTITSEAATYLGYYTASTTIDGSSSLAYSNGTLQVGNSSGNNQLNIVPTTNTGSGASTNGALFVNCTSDTTGLCLNINQESSNLSNAQPLLYVNAGSPDNTTASGTQTLSTSTTSFSVVSTSGWPTSGYLLVQQSTSSSQNANGVLLQYTSVSSSPASFNAAAGTLYPVTGSTFSVVTGDKVYYVNNNDHQNLSQFISYGLNGAATNLKFFGVGAQPIEWTNGALNNASGSGQFQWDMPNAYGANPQTADEIRLEVRNQTNSAFNPAFGIEGINEGAATCFGDCLNNQAPWNAPWEGDVNIYPNSANGVTDYGTTPEVVIREPDVTFSANLIQAETSSSKPLFTVDASGNVSSTGNITTQGSVNANTLNASSSASFGATSTFLGNVSTTIAANSFVATNGQGILVATGTPSGGGVATTSVYSTGYLQEASSSGAITNSPVYSGSATTISIGTTTVNGIVNVVNASNTAVLGISATTGATSSAVTLNVLGNASTSPTAPVNIFQILSDGHINATGTQPTMGICGSSPSVIGSDAAGTITVGSGVVTSCTINWQVPYETTNYRCLATDNSAAISSAVTAQTTSTATFGLSATLGGGNIFYMCSETL